MAAKIKAEAWNKGCRRATIVAGPQQQLNIWLIGRPPLAHAAF
jgi:hypothetical protein